jgi:putative ABC transport system ATP-binding protein
MSGNNNGKHGPDDGNGTTPSKGIIIKVRDLQKTYQQGEIEVHALRGVDFDLGSGEFTVVAGPSGSGKTTLLNLIGCLDKPTGGTIHIDGRPVTAFNRNQAAAYRLANIGFVFQAYNLIPVLSAYENAEFTLMMLGVGADERRERVMPLLERVGLGGMTGRRPHELSGGQQQRVAVVRAIASDPSIVLADEPTANLDTETSRDLMDLMLELNEENGTTFLFSSHDHVVINRSKRHVSLESGLIVDDEVRETP